MARIEVVTFTLHKHENADALSIAKIADTEWECVVKTSDWTVARRAIYVPIESLVPVDQPEFAWLEKDAKYKDESGRRLHRVRTMRLRGVVSEGLLVPIPEWANDLSADEIELRLGITRYEPPEPKNRGAKNITKGGVSPQTRGFDRYQKFDNGKKYPRLFSDGDIVRITEKIHGTNFRIGLVRVENDYVLCVGSHNTERLPGADNVYSEIAREHFGDVDRLRAIATQLGYPAPKTFVVYGEIFGPQIQDLAYGQSRDKSAVAIFDVKVDGKWLNWDSVVLVAKAINVPTVPLLYFGKYSRGVVRLLTDGFSVWPGANHIREGVVVTIEDPIASGESVSRQDGERKVLKYISTEYALRKGAKDSH